MRAKQTIGLFVAVMAGLAGCGDDGGSGVDLPKFQANCTAGTLSAEAKLPAGKQGDGSVILPGGRRLSPLGRQVELGGFPMAARVMPGGKHVVVSDGGYATNYLSVIDMATGAVTHRTPFAEPQGLFFGLAVRASDGRVFASGGGGDRIYVYTYESAAGTLTQTRAPIMVSGPSPQGRDLVAGLALSNDGRTLYAVGQASSALIAFDADTGMETGAWSLNSDYPNDVVVAPAAFARNEAYVTSWGSGQLLVIDLATPFDMSPVKARIEVGKSPATALAMPGGKVLVANGDADSLSLIDVATRTVTRTVPAARAADLPLGTAPSNLVLSADGTRLYVTDSGENAVDILDPTTLNRLGRFPTSWFPTAVAVGDGDQLVVATGKGQGAGPITDSEGSGFLKGGISIMTAPADADLAMLTSTVVDNNTRPKRLAALPTCSEMPRKNALPLMPGEETPIKHVFVIMRENKTYDAELGDLAGSNGDPSLVLFGERFTPNLHALARQFSVLDNFYSPAEASIQGHQWGTSGTTTDFTEKAWLTTWGRGYRAASLFVAPNSAPAQGYIWHQLERQNVKYINFGQAVGTLVGAAKPGQDRFDDKFPGVVYNMDVEDKRKGDYIKLYLETEAEWPAFTYVLLPNNHTEGDSPGKPTPESYVADNDEGTGVVVDAITHSKFWPRSVVFIWEDDPQDGGDHVEGHRSPLVVISPWVKRGYVSSANADVPSMWKTIEHLLALQPISLYTADAAPLYDLFTNTPDYTPYSYVPRMIPTTLNPRTSPVTAMTTAANMDFSHPDSAPGLGRILWQMRKGTPPPWGMTPIIAREEEDEEAEALEEGWWEIDTIRRYYPSARMGVRDDPSKLWGLGAGVYADDDDDDD